MKSPRNCLFLVVVVVLIVAAVCLIHGGKKLAAPGNVEVTEILNG